MMFKNPGTDKLDKQAFGSVPPKELELKGNTTLLDLQKDYVLFSPALLFLGPGSQCDFFADFAQLEKIALAPVSVRCPSPIFRGLTAPNGDDSWNYVLFGLEPEVWDKFVGFMNTIAIRREAPAPYLCSILATSVDIVDTFAVKHNLIAPLLLPRVTVKNFELHTTLGTGLLTPSPDGIPAFAWQASIPEGLLKFNDAITAGDSDPYAKIGR